jgi:hypothetical protein
MGLNVFTLFVGYGCGSLIFGPMLPLRIETALNVFGASAIFAGILAPFLVPKRINKGTASGKYGHRQPLPRRGIVDSRAKPPAAPFDYCHKHN